MMFSITVTLYHQCISSDVVYVTDHAYAEDEVADMEQSLLTVLGGFPESQPCALLAASTPLARSQPTPLDFLIRYVVMSECTPWTSERARHFLERCLLEFEMCRVKPSLLAAACLYLAMELWSRKLQGFTGHPLPSVMALAGQINSYVALDASSSDKKSALST